MSDGDELIYEPFKKRKRRRNPNIEEDKQGQQIEYDRGYLQARAKAKRGVSLQRKPKKRPFVPEVTPECGIDILYVLEFNHLPATINGALRVELWWRPTTGRPALQPLILGYESTAPSVEDRRLMQLLWPFRERSEGTRGNVFYVPPEAQKSLIGALSEARNLRWSARQDCPGQWQLHRLTISDWENTPWFAQLNQEPGGLHPRIWLGAPEEDLDLDKWQALGAAGWLLAGGTLYRIKLNTAFPLLANWLRNSIPYYTAREAASALQALTLDGGADLSNLPPELQCLDDTVTPVGQLYITTARFKHLGLEQLQCDLSFKYAGAICADNDSSERVAAAGRVFQRNRDAEDDLRKQLRELDFRLVTRTGGDEDPGWKLVPSKLDRAVRTLVLSGWEITAEGKTYRRPTAKNLTVSASGIDWLEVDGVLEFGNSATAGLPALLAAAKSGSKTVLLDDGTHGILPTEWLEHFTALVEIGQVSSDGKIAFRQQQAALVQALLDEQLTDLDGRYTQAIEASSRTPQATPMAAPAEFKATLRPYQQLGLGWMWHLRTLGLGGILADDMGLGKTIQVLALLATRHTENPGRPSLIVMPSSLIFNWSAEAEKFAPHLRCGCYYGAGRRPTEQWFSQYDLVFTTYGTLRLDATSLAAIQFDYVILDESQAIKNAESSTAKACRILKANFRIAMTGTPIENHLSELFSQLCFLNPGLFSENFITSIGKENHLLTNPETARRLRHYIKPFILRRRKEQVATDLPAKTDQILWCNLENPQKYYYDELRDFYRRELQGQDSASQMSSILTALLRLRQAACHAGLVNDTCAGVPSAKLQLLHEQLTPLIESGHKALVFSQFTGLLQLVRKDCESAGWKYCYLDGSTRNRGELVKQFQEDPETSLFLISLKAGGVGLNLTAADYVYILDPWWNPAAEAQAIDRAYRIGQQRPVFAYRMLAKDTVEEKVLQMQLNKRALADAALDNAGELPPGITAQDLRELLK